MLRPRVGHRPTLLYVEEVMILQEVLCTTPLRYGHWQTSSESSSRVPWQSGMFEDVTVYCIFGTELWYPDAVYDFQD
jgi:hypothetical protein